MTEAKLEQNLPEGFELTPFNEDYISDPHSVLKRAAIQGPVYYDSAFKRYVVMGHDCISQVLQDKTTRVERRHANANTFSNLITEERDPKEEGEAYTGKRPWLLYIDDPDHKRIRAVVAEYFLPQNLENFRDVVRGIAQSLVTEISIGQELEFVSSIAKKLPTRVIGRYLGLNESLDEELRDLVEASARNIFNFPTEEQAKNGQAADEKLIDLFERELSDRMYEPKGDLMSEMAKHIDAADGINMLEATWTCHMLCLAGSITVSDMLGNGVHILSQSPDLLSELRADGSLAAKFVEEVVRLEPSVDITQRITTEQTTLGDIEIPKGECLHVFLSTANRDESVWKNPDQPDLSREETYATSRSFGGGMHRCLGYYLAKIEGEEFFLALARSFSSISESHGERAKTPNFRGFESLCITCSN